MVTSSPSVPVDWYSWTSPSMYLTVNSPGALHWAVRMMSDVGVSPSPCS